MSSSRDPNEQGKAKLPVGPGVLLVDSCPDSCSAVLDELRRALPHGIIHAIGDAQSWESRLRLADFHLVITEYHLDWTDGLSIVDAVKRRCPDCPVIMYTACQSEDVAAQALGKGADDYLVKRPGQFGQISRRARDLLIQREVNDRSKPAEP